MTNKKYFRCSVCNDIHYGFKEPKLCPTCNQENKYIECDKQEAFFILGFDKNIGKQTNKQDLINKWEKYAQKNNLKLNEDKVILNLLVKGELKHEKEHNLKLCPCRLRDGTKEKDLTLLCPCNFEIHSTWKSEERCWCGLFWKKEV